MREIFGPLLKYLDPYFSYGVQILQLQNREPLIYYNNNIIVKFERIAIYVQKLNINITLKRNNSNAYNTT